MGTVISLIAALFVLGSATTRQANTTVKTSATDSNYNFVPVSASFAPTASLNKALAQYVTQNAGLGGDMFSYVYELSKSPASARITMVRKLESYPIETQGVRILDSNFALQVGYLGNKLEAQRATAVLVESWRKYVPVELTITEGKNERKIFVQLGYSVSIATKIATANGTLTFDELVKGLGARVSLKKFSAISTSEVIGLSRRSITSALPTGAELLIAADPKESDPVKVLFEEISTKFKSIRNSAWDVAGDAESGLVPLIVGIDTKSLAILKGEAEIKGVIF